MTTTAKHYPILHLIKSGKGWTATTFCGRRMPKGACAQGEVERFLAYDESWTCDRCREALLASMAKAEKKAEPKLEFTPEPWSIEDDLADCPDLRTAPRMI